jgi:hypothetical protein
VLALVPGLRERNRDLWPTFADLHQAGNAPDISDYYFRGRHVVLIARLEGAVIMPQAYENFRKFADAYLGSPAPSTLIAVPGHTAVFAVYELK